ncbi:hypothetical protein CPB84DRAFT_1750890 [Gymnopilus junonius]|uniref:CENP-V/GFA domain-containing protein n=1 Tax=Gymnopilus junonius TaxID=109634 RepID=A0A9P5NCU1_GYMJU|nr:hypothetical protein CPB84DRAFT_1750890 [Gymnopilus junonius]
MTTTLVNVTCHCGTNKFKVAFHTSSLPIASDLCHCNTCRHSTGLMFIHTAPIINAPLASDASPDDMAGKPENLQHLKAYSKPSGRLTRDSDSWSVYTGILEQPQGIVQVGAHRFVESTIDGGFANHYPVVSGIELPRYKSMKEDGETLPFDWKAPKLLKAQETLFKANATLSAYCDCKSINLTLLRETTITKPKPNVCKWSTRHQLDLLDRVNIIDTYTSLPVVLDPKEGETRTPGLAQYESSPGIFRESCATCGAKVFYWTRNRKGGDILDVGAGLLDQEQEGSRADRWFAWADKVPHPDNPVDKMVLDDLRMD